ncbi:MAG: DUF924 domain-containing protein [Proteobacteria bacterium]|nr:MAG: DUF924 domain-containing protein [Pseudomonadota bacterium]
MDPRAEALLHFWFGRVPPTPESVAARATFWFEPTPEEDADLARRFGALHAEAHAGELDAWQDEPRGALALVLLLDQLPRNLFRGSARAFASDARALAVARAALARGDDAELVPIETAFLLLPLEHAESMEAQEESVRRVEALAHGAPPAWREMLEGWADYARQHRDIVARFGRFPHRNRALGRASTAEESAFLSAGGPSFGQGATDERG